MISGVRKIVYYNVITLLTINKNLTLWLTESLIFHAQYGAGCRWRAKTSWRCPPPTWPAGTRNQHQLGSSTCPQ